MASDSQVRNGLYGLDYREPDERRVESVDRKTYDIKSLWNRHHEIVNLAAQGYKQVDIAYILNIDPQTVSNTLNSQIGEKKLSEIRKERDEKAKKVHEKIVALTERALQVYHEILDNENGAATLKDQKDVADTVTLELSGLRAPTRIQSHHSVSLSVEELNDFKKRGIQAAKEAGLVIDVESEPETLTE